MTMTNLRNAIQVIGLEILSEIGLERLSEENGCIERNVIAMTYIHLILRFSTRDAQSG
jgi:hypothetical protein